MERHARTSSVVFLMCLCSTSSFMTSSSVTSPGFDVEKLSGIIETSHRCRKSLNPGMAVSVVKNGHTLLSRGYGVTSPNGNTRVTSNTRFNVASLTKAVTAALLVKVMEESGRYNLSTPVREILGPYFRFEDDLRTEHATVEDLLSHKMAIPGNSRMRFDSTLTRKTVVDRVRHLKSYDTFRTTYIYSNIMYGLASRMTEVVGRGRWESLVRSHFFQPLGMRRSTFSTEADLNDSDTAKPYVLYKGNLRPISYDLPKLYGELVGSGAFISTANDMAKWMNFHLYGGINGQGQRVMGQASVEELHKPRTAMPKSSMPLFVQPDIPVTTSFDIYALGWWTGYYRGYPILGHSGASYGYRAFVILVPSLKIGVFVVMNGDDRSYSYRGPLLNLILDNVLGVSPWVDTNTLCTFPSPWHNISSPPPPPYDSGRPLAHNLSAYLGVYENPAYGRLEIRLVEDRSSRRRARIYRSKKAFKSGQSFARRNRALRPGSISLRNQASPRLALIFGFARWDLIPLVPKYAALNSEVSSRADFPEYFYGLGRGVNAYLDYAPFIIHPPSTGSDVIEELSASAFEKRLPPVFKRVYPGSNDSESHVVTKTSVSMILCLFVSLIFR